VTDAAELVPELTVDDVEPAFAGIRAQALARNGELLADFAFSRSDRALHVRNAPSRPGTRSPQADRLARARQRAGASPPIFGAAPRARYACRR
jgi:L-2-hydroxyglutarate oxidase LhgO